MARGAAEIYTLSFSIPDLIRREVKLNEKGNSISGSKQVIDLDFFLAGKCPVPPKQDRRCPCLPAGRKGHNMNEISFARILLATLCPGSPAVPPRPNGVGGELHFGSTFWPIHPCNPSDAATLP